MSEREKGLAIMKQYKRVGESMRRHFEEQYKDLQLTGPQGMLVHYLASKGAMKVSDVSHCMHLSNSTVSSLLDRLEQQGCVERIRSEEDRRVVMVDLTPTFREATKQRFKAVESFIVEITSEASDEELSTILEGLTLLGDLLKRKQDRSIAEKTGV